MSAIKIHCTGRLVEDAKVYTGKSGKKRIFARIACTESWKDSDDNKHEHTEFIPIVVWGDNRVDALAPWLLKGRLIGIEGVLVSNEERDEQGNFVKKDWVIRVERRGLEFLDRKPENVQPAQPQTQAGVNPDMIAAIAAAIQQMQAQPAQTVPTAQVMEDNLPY